MPAAVPNPMPIPVRVYLLSKMLRRWSALSGPITYEFTRQFLLTDPLIRHSVAPIDAAGMAVEECIFQRSQCSEVMAVLAFFVNSSAGIVPREIDVPVVVVRFSN